MTYSRIAGTGGYLPDRVMTNKEMESIVETSDDWIHERSGIRQRHIVADGEMTSDMALAAGKEALKAAQNDASEVYLVVVATTTPDRIFPGVACILQRKLGVKNFPAFDVHAACSGFVFALDIVDRFIRTGGARCALIVGAEIYSRIIDWSDRGTCVLFGDGAGAVVLRASDEPGIIATEVNSDGNFEDLLYVTGGPASGVDALIQDAAYIKMKGHEVFRQAVGKLGSIAKHALESNGFEQKDLTWLVPHQANQRIIKATAKKLGMSMDKVILTVGEHGNTSGGSIPLALDTGIRDGRIKRGDILFLEAVGSGFTWGSIILKY